MGIANLLSRLGITELLQLFGGRVDEDDEGQPFIFVKNKETLPNPMGDDEDDQDEE